MGRDTVQRLTTRMIQEAARVGNCVIIGRGAQCVVQHHSHALRMLVDAPPREKPVRMKLRHPDEQNLPAMRRCKDFKRLHDTQHLLRLPLGRPEALPHHQNQHSEHRRVRQSDCAGRQVVKIVKELMPRLFRRAFKDEFGVGHWQRNDSANSSEACSDQKASVL